MDGLHIHRHVEKSLECYIERDHRMGLKVQKVEDCLGVELIDGFIEKILELKLCSLCGCPKNWSHCKGMEE